ncbi:MAG TPA: PAS domain-containing protein [Mesotoga sp.]|nr:PAS domain-containing protein [Thermotogota bacterium]HQQ57126.1 PAS domain-containing protein [Mesotoga sp.]
MSHERSSLDPMERDFRPSTEVERNLNPILDIDIDGKTTYQNAAATSFLNSSGLKDPVAFLPEELPQEIWKSKEPSPFNYEKTIGEKIFFVSLNPLPGGDIARIYAFDITQIRTLERQQLETKELLAKVTGSVTDMLYALDKELRYIYWNSASEVMTGLKSIDVIGKHVTDVFPEDATTAKAMASYRRVLQSGKPESSVFEYKSMRKTSILEINIYPLGEGISVFARDITEQKNAERKLEIERKKLRQILDYIPEGIYMVNESYDIEYVNPVLIEKYGPIEGKKCYEFFLKFDAPCPWCKNDQIHSGQPVRWERRSERSGRIYDLIDIPVFNDDGSISKLQVVHDITDMRTYQEKVERLNVELEARVAERTTQLEAVNKELEAFAYSVSHDLRAPLRAVDGYSRIIEEDYVNVLDSEGLRLFGVIKRNIKKMDQLILDLLALSRVNRTELVKSKIDMIAMVNSLFNEVVTVELREKVKFTVQNLPEVYGDSVMMKQVWINLLSNALKFSATREVITIEVGGYSENGTNTYYVKDNGVGFNQKYANKVFEIFQRLHSSKEFEGTGVGLSIVQRIIHRHGGSVRAEGEENQGATFYFSIPER